MHKGRQLKNFLSSRSGWCTYVVEVRPPVKPPAEVFAEKWSKAHTWDDESGRGSFIAKDAVFFFFAGEPAIWNYDFKCNTLSKMKHLIWGTVTAPIKVILPFKGLGPRLTFDLFYFWPFPKMHWCKVWEKMKIPFCISFKKWKQNVIDFIICKVQLL